MAGSVKINIEALRNFETPLIKNAGSFQDVLVALKGCVDVAGEGTGISEALQRNGIALEKAHNEAFIPATQTVLNTLATSAENAEEVQKVLSSFDAVSTSAVTEAEVQQGTRPTAFQR